MLVAMAGPLHQSTWWANMTNQKTMKDKVQVWYTQGMCARTVDGKKLSDNPYGDGLHSIASYAWAAGWYQEPVSPEQIINDAQSHNATRYTKEQN